MHETFIQNEYIIILFGNLGYFGKCTYQTNEWTAVSKKKCVPDDVTYFPIPQLVCTL